MLVAMAIVTGPGRDDIDDDNMKIDDSGDNRTLNQSVGIPSQI